MVIVDTRTQADLQNELGQNDDPFAKSLSKAVDKISSKLGKLIWGEHKQNVEAVNMADANDDNVVDMQELENALRARQSSMSSIEGVPNTAQGPSVLRKKAKQIMFAYDMNNDGVLDEEERKAMNLELEEAENTVREDRTNAIKNDPELIFFFILTSV